MGAEEKEDIFVVWWCGGVMWVAWAGKDAVKERGFGGICGQWRCGWAMGQVLKGIVGLLVLFSGAFLVFEMLLPVYCVLANEWMVEF